MPEREAAILLGDADIMADKGAGQVELVGQVGSGAAETDARIAKDAVASINAAWSPDGR